MINRSNVELAREIDKLKKQLATMSAPRLANASVTVESGANLDLTRSLITATAPAANLARALVALVPPADYADGNVTVYYGAANNAETTAVYAEDIRPQTPPATGDLWLRGAPVAAGDPTGAIDLSDYDNPADVAELVRWDGTGWAAVADQSYLDAFIDANEAAATFDGRIETYWSNTEPVGSAFGDLWFKINAANLAHRWDGAKWVALSPDNAQSGNYVPGVNGWRLAPNGDAELNNVLARGNVVVGNALAPPTWLGPGSVSSGPFDLEQWLQLRRAWGSHPLVATGGPVIGSGTDLAAVAGAATQYFDGPSTSYYDLLSAPVGGVPRRVLLDATDFLEVEVVLELDVTHTTVGNGVLVAEIDYQQQGAAAIVTSTSLVFDSKTAGYRSTVTKSWRFTLYGASANGGPSSSWRIRPRVRVTGTTGQYTIREQHSTYSVTPIRSGLFGSV